MVNWTRRLEKAEKFLEQVHEHGRKVYRRYEDERDDLGLAQRANFFYANVNILKESLFNSMPKPDVSRVQRGDFQDDAARVAANVVQRGLTYEVHCAKDFKEAVEGAIFDRLIPGIGQVWVTFEVDKTPQEEDADGDFTGGDPIPGTETIGIDSVFWEDFLYEPVRKWSKCGWVARRLYLTKGEMKAAYGDNVLNDLGLGHGSDEGTPEEINQDKYCVYEVWSKRDRKVYHIYKGREKPLKELDDPYQLKDFFPCPRPLIANATTKAFKPITDYHIAQDQYLQLDNLYCRIQLIVDAIKVVGLYDAANTSISRLLTGAENTLIPVDNWAMHAERGGARGQIDWYPVEQVATVLQSLYAAFEATKAILFEITGMSDIVRGASNQYETASAQQIKAQFASVRMNGYQRDVAVFVRDLLRIMAELFTQLYSDEKILQIIGQLPPADMQLLPQAAQILRNDVLTKYKVDIQTNSLTQADWALEKEQRGELVTTVGQMISQVAQVEGSPELTMLGVQLIKFAMSGFKGGSELEGWIDDMLDGLAQQAQQPPEEPQPSPEEQKAQAEMQKMQAEMQMDQQRMEMELQGEQMRLQMEQQRMEMELRHKEQMAQMEMQIQQVKLAMAQQEAQLRVETKVREAEVNAAVKEQSAAMGLEQQAASFEQKQAQEAAKPKKDTKK